MNKWIKLLLAMTLFSSGFAAGYFVRKRSEVSFEVVSEEELLAEAEKDAQNANKGQFSGQEGVPTYRIEEEPEESKEGQETAISSDSEGIGEGQKIAYFRKWKAEESLDKYSTFTSVEPDDPVSDVEDIPDSDFMQVIEDDIRKGISGPEIEAGTIEDWDHWVGIKDGDYDPIEIRWYEKDNVFCDSNDEEMDNPEKFIGFDIRKQFEKINFDTTGDPNVRVLFNHRYRAIYHITRINGSWEEKKRMEDYGSEVDDESEDEDIYDRFRGLRV